MPNKISNSFAFSFSQNFILIMGGITKKDIHQENKIYEIQNKVHVLKIT